MQGRKQGYKPYGSRMAQLGKQRLNFSNYQPPTNSKQQQYTNNVNIKDSLTNFQNQLNGFATQLRHSRQGRQNTTNKPRLLPQLRLGTEPVQPQSRKRKGSHQNREDSTKDLKKDLEEIKKLVDGQKELQGIESRLDRLHNEMAKQQSPRDEKNNGTSGSNRYPNMSLYEEEEKRLSRYRRKLKSEIQNEYESKFTPHSQPVMQQPMMQPTQPQIIYPPNPPAPIFYFPPERRQKKRKTKKYESSSSQESESSSEESFKPAPKAKRSKRPKLSTLNTDRSQPQIKRETLPYIRKKRNIKRLRKIFFVVAFPFFLRSEAKKLSEQRKNNLRRFWLDSFNPQIISLKNWLLESHKFSLALILQKKQLNFSFVQEERESIKRQKQNFIIEVIYIACQRMKLEATTMRVSAFTELLFTLCRKGSHIITRFWTAAEMEKVCISEYYGFLRIDESLQKYLICLIVFVKVLFYNMLLQPHKFDNQTFKKGEQPLKGNMYVITSVYYRIVKDCLDEYLSTPRKASLGIKQGNWLKVKKQFVVECCDPMIYKAEYPEPGEEISGMITSDDVEGLRMHEKWVKTRMQIFQVVEILHKEMAVKGAAIKRSIKDKMYG